MFRVCRIFFWPRTEWIWTTQDGELPAKMLFCSQVNWPTKRIKRKCVPTSNGDILCRTSGSSNSSTHYNLPTSGQVGFLGSKHNRPHFNSFWQLAQPASWSSWSSWSLCRLLSWGTLRYSNMVYHPPQQKNTHTHTPSNTFSLKYGTRGVPCPKK